MQPQMQNQAIQMNQYGNANYNQAPMQQHAIQINKNNNVATVADKLQLKAFTLGERIAIFLSGLLTVLLPIFWPSCIKVCRQYERVVHFRLGKVISVTPKGPGLFFIIPLIDTFRIIDMRITTLDVPPQNTMTKDSVPCKVDAVCFSFITNPIYAVVNVNNYSYATSQLAQTTLRSVVGDSSLDQLVSAREVISKKLQSTLDEATDQWGVKICAVELSDLNLPIDMQKAMANQAEKEKERIAKLIHADAELQSATYLRQAAETLSKSNAAIKLRFFQTLAAIGTDQMTEIYFPLPVQFSTEQESATLPVD